MTRQDLARQRQANHRLAVIRRVEEVSGYIRDVVSWAGSRSCQVVSRAASQVSVNMSEK